jgi:hypothetical protein
MGLSVSEAAVKVIAIWKDYKGRTVRGLAFPIAQA